MPVPMTLPKSARRPLDIPVGVTVKIVDRTLSVKGKHGELHLVLKGELDVKVEGNHAQVVALKENQKVMVGTTHALLKNMIQGTHNLFQKKLSLNGVGYRAKIAGKALELSVGHSHPDLFQIPEGIIIETPTPTEIIVKGIDKAVVGETAAKIRAFRKVERYKGKGLRYFDEKVILKEAKKK